MSDERKNDKGGFGPKKPKATFGDVMLGIPAGRSSDEKRDRGNPQASGGEVAPEAPREARPPKRRRAQKAEEKPRGPLVVVKRASGVVETRGPLPEPAPAERPAEVAPEPARATPAPVPSSALYEEVPESESFAELFEAAKQEVPSARRAVRVGEKVSGPIFQLGADTAFVQLGGKSEAMIELRELQDAEGVLRFGVGDVVEAYVIEVGARGILLSRTISKGAASMAMLQEARLSGMPVEGLVLAVNKGGLEVAVGDVRAFCPVSQIDLRFVENPDTFVGERLRFRVTEVRERKVVLSRRALLEEEQKALAEQTRKGLEVGKVVRGRVSGVRDFGAFVDLGGIEGLIPVSELSHTRVGHPSEVVKAGEEVEVEVLRIDPPDPTSPDKARHKERIALSLRARQEDPWKVAAQELKVGDRLKAKVVRLQPFGAFVELRPGVDGLIHVSALSDRRVAHPRDVVQVGEEVWVEVEKVDPAERRIGLRRITEDQAAGPATERPAKEEKVRLRVDQTVTGTVDRIEPYGIFLAFPGGRGLVPANETMTERGTDLKRVFSLGQEVKAQIIEIDPSGKIRLSITALKRAEEKADIDEWIRSQKKSGGGKQGFGTFADLLKDKKLL